MIPTPMMSNPHAMLTPWSVGMRLFLLWGLSLFIRLLEHLVLRSLLFLFPPWLVLLCKITWLPMLMAGRWLAVPGIGLFFWTAELLSYGPPWVTYFEKRHSVVTVDSLSSLSVIGGEQYALQSLHCPLLNTSIEWFSNLRNQLPSKEVFIHSSLRHL